jgi:NADH:ubiquinone oxidoreductase subunit 6 (subunit J)
VSTAQRPGSRPAGAAATVARRLASSYLVQFLGFVAVLVLVVVMLARQSEDTGSAHRVQIVLFALAGMLALVGTVLLAPPDRQLRGPTTQERAPSGADRARTGVVLIGTAVVLVAAAGLVGLW